MKDIKLSGFAAPDYIIFEKGRIFVDICKSGCGSGCTYCYVNTKGENQVLLDIDQIQEICEYTREHIDCNNKIISLCPNTEPLKTKEGIQRVLYIIKFFSDLGSYIQISTKECIPDFFWEELQQFDCSKIYINISVPLIFDTDRFEPGAAKIRKRLEAFKQSSVFPELHLCLYIKPYTKKSRREQLMYARIINEYNIKRVCVGVKFLKDTSGQPCISLYQKAFASSLFREQADQIKDFLTLLRTNTNATIYGSSICCIYHDHYGTCDLQLFEYNKRVCHDCAIWSHTYEKA